MMIITSPAAVRLAVRSAIRSAIRMMRRWGRRGAGNRLAGKSATTGVNICGVEEGTSDKRLVDDGGTEITDAVRKTTQIGQ